MYFILLKEVGVLDSNEIIDIAHIDILVEKYKVFMIRTVSDFTGRYVSIENDEEFSIALSAFAEAVTRYDVERGSFISYARLVIESRLKNYVVKEAKRPTQISMDALAEEGIELSNQMDSKSILQEEIDLYKKELSFFGLSLEQLADEAPKHKDTRTRAIDAAELISKDKKIVEDTYIKKRLPIRKVVAYTNLTEKIVKRSKLFILATMIIFIKKYPKLLCWIQESRCSHVL